LEFNADELEKDFQKYLQEFEDEAAGRNLKDGRVPQTVWWLVMGDEYLGRVSIRHRLTDKLMRIGGHIGYEVRPSERRKGYGTLLLKLGLQKAKELGIERPLLTCDATNASSRKIIEGAGGILENEVPGENAGDPAKLRFWFGPE